MYERCPGQDRRHVKIDLIKCPHCGYKLEIFSDEMQAKCPSCQKNVLRQKMPSCIDWCKSAKECISKKRWEKLKKKHDDF